MCSRIIANFLVLLLVRYQKGEALAHIQHVNRWDTASYLQLSDLTLVARKWCCCCCCSWRGNKKFCVWGQTSGKKVYENQWRRRESVPDTVFCQCNFQLHCRVAAFCHKSKYASLFQWWKNCKRIWRRFDEQKHRSGNNCIPLSFLSKADERQRVI